MTIGQRVEKPQKIGGVYLDCNDATAQVFCKRALTQVGFLQNTHRCSGVFCNPAPLSAGFFAGRF